MLFRGRGQYDLTYRIAYKESEKDDLGNLFGIYITVLPGCVLFVVAFFMFEVPYLR